MTRARNLILGSLAWAKTLTRALDDPDVIAGAKKFAPKFREWYSNSRMLKTYGELFREVLS